MPYVISNGIDTYLDLKYKVDGVKVSYLECVSDVKKALIDKISYVQTLVGDYQHIYLTINGVRVTDILIVGFNTSYVEILIKEFIFDRTKNTVLNDIFKNIFIQDYETIRSIDDTCNNHPTSTGNA